MAITALDMGSTMMNRMNISFAPSICAASTMDFETPEKKARMTMTLYALRSPVRISAQWLSNRPSLFTTIKEGMEPAENHMVMVIKTEYTLFQPKLLNAIGYAANAVRTIPNTVPMTQTNSVFPYAIHRYLFCATIEYALPVKSTGKTVTSLRSMAYLSDREMAIMFIKG